MTGLTVNYIFSMDDDIPLFHPLIAGPYMSSDLLQGGLFNLTSSPNCSSNNCLNSDCNCPLISVPTRSAHSLKEKSEKMYLELIYTSIRS